MDKNIPAEHYRVLAMTSLSGNEVRAAAIVKGRKHYCGLSVRALN